MGRPSRLGKKPKVVVCTPFEYIGKIGIHLTNPSKQELEDAVEDAKRRGFVRVYVHVTDPKNWKP